MMFSSKMFLRLVSLCVFLFLYSEIKAQDDLESLLEKETDHEEQNAVSSTFKSTRLINGHSVELRKQGALEFIISHRFGTINSGIKNLFGLDDANIRIGLDYSITNRFTIGAGRSSFQKVYDGFIKYKFFSQEGPGAFPVTIVYYSTMAINTLPWSNPERPNRSTDRYSFANQILIARKFDSGTSVQLMPTVVHRNLVPTGQEDNLIYSLGAGGRQKITKRVAITLEYYYQFNNNSPLEYHNSASVGFDIETGGHVFQLHFTNSNPTFERGFITETTGDFFSGDIHFGFNITRTFQLAKNK